jgi:F-type H+-transporting ATPase subunit a
MMFDRRVKSLLVAVFSVFALSVPAVMQAQDNDTEEHGASSTPEGHNEPKKGGFNAEEVIFNHVLNAHEFHFMDLPGENGESHPVTLPLPVIIYSAERGGFTSFMSSRFEHGHKAYNGYKLHDGKIVAVKDDGTIDESVHVLDLSLTRNVVQMFLALIILVWLMLKVAGKYKTGQGITSAPKGAQNLMEPVIGFIRDEVAKPNLGHKYQKYLPYLLTVFLFILINNIVGLIPGSANVTGNIAFTVVLGVISFLVILVSANKHYWGHIFWPPVPGFVKFIMIPVEILSIFTKPFALIIRLFANMLAGHIIIICLISLIFIFANISKGIGWGFSPVSIAFATFIYLIEVLVAFIQAFIFTNLTAVFIGQAIEDHHATTEEAHNGIPPTEPAII